MMAMTKMVTIIAMMIMADESDDDDGGDEEKEQRASVAFFSSACFDHPPSFCSILFSALETMFRPRRRRYLRKQNRNRARLSLRGRDEEPPGKRLSPTPWERLSPPLGPEREPSPVVSVARLLLLLCRGGWGRGASASSSAPHYSKRPDVLGQA